MHLTCLINVITYLFACLQNNVCKRTRSRSWRRWMNILSRAIMPSSFCFSSRSPSSTFGVISCLLKLHCTHDNGRRQNDKNILHFQDSLLSQYQNVSILDFVGAKDDGGGGGDNWIYKMCTAPVNSPPPPNQNSLGLTP